MPRQMSAVDGEVCPERVDFGAEAARSGPWSRRGAGGLTGGWVVWDNQAGFLGPGLGDMVFVLTIPSIWTLVVTVADVASYSQAARVSVTQA